MKRSDLPPGHDDSPMEEAEARKLGALLKKYSPAPARDSSGLNAAVLGRLRAETPVPAAPAMPLRRLVWGGLGGLAAAAALFVALVEPVLRQPGPPPEYYARILKATSSDPAVSAVAVHSRQDNVTLVWIDGLDYVPAQKAKD